MILSIIILTGVLFFVLFWWQKHIEQAGYLARIYQDTIEKIEMSRLAAPTDDKLAKGECAAEIILETSERGKNGSMSTNGPLPVNIPWDL